MMVKFLEPEYKSSNVEYQNGYISVTSDSLVLRLDNEGKEEQYFKKYFTLNCKDFVVGLVVKDNKILIVNQYRVPLRRFTKEFVAGSIEYNETPEQTILKELEEEAGIKANKVNFLGRFNPLSGSNGNTGYAYLINDFEEVERKLETYEKFTNLTIEWMDIKDFSNMIRTNGIMDGVSLTAWALYNS